MDDKLSLEDIYTDDSPSTSFDGLQNIDNDDSNIPPNFPVELLDHSNKSSSKPVQINSREPIRIESDHFSGHAQFKVRSEAFEDDPFFKQYFEGRKRCMEVQFQGKLKKKIDKPILFGGELDGPLPKLGFFLNSIVKIIAAFMNVHIPGVSANLSHSNGQVPHIMMPLYEATDHFWVTPLASSTSSTSTPISGGRDIVNVEEKEEVTGGDILPEIGVPAIYPSMTKEERKDTEIVFDTNNIYSFSIHSPHLDVATWSIVNIPGVRSLSLKRFWKDTPINLVAYYLDDDNIKQYLFKYRVRSTIDDDDLLLEEGVGVKKRKA